MSDQISFLPMLDDAEHPTWLLSGKPGIQNENGVYVENVMEFREFEQQFKFIELGRKYGLPNYINLVFRNNYAEYYMEQA